MKYIYKTNKLLLCFMFYLIKSAGALKKNLSEQRQYGKCGGHFSYLKFLLHIICKDGFLLIKIPPHTVAKTRVT